jgi:predicted dehydrogenase
MIRNSLLSATQAYASSPMPKQTRPIVIIGAGGIVRAAHLPAYEKGKFSVIGLMDQNLERAESLAKSHAIAHTFDNIHSAVQFAPKDVVYDIAVPASQLPHILPHIPDGSAVLMQKPMGETLQDARIIRDLCRTKRLTASVNFSLRYAPNNLAISALAKAGLLGDLHDLQVQTTTFTPWDLWTFLSTAPRLEILYHSIHYFDLIRSWLGNPNSVYAKTVSNPHTATLAATKTIAILDYGENMRVFVASNHHHNFGQKHQHSFVQWEGTLGAARIRMGLNLDYPIGIPDTAEFAERGCTEECWQSLPVAGANIPDGFIGTMGALQAFVEGSTSSLPTHYEDAFQTMALVEALYSSSAQSGEVLQLDSPRPMDPSRT